MSSNTVKDRSGSGREPARKPAGSGGDMPSKAERRALGKAAARKRAIERRRRELRNRVLQIATPIVVVGLIIGAIVVFGGGGGNTPAPTDTAAAAPSASGSATPWTLPDGLDPQLGTKPAVTAGEGTLDSLKVTTLVTGTGPALQSGDYVEANYVLADYATGEELQSSWTDATNATPFDFPLGVGNVIAGWDQGLIGVTVGSRVQLDVPAALAYPDGGGPAGDLRFIVDVLTLPSSANLG